MGEEGCPGGVAVPSGGTGRGARVVVAVTVTGSLKGVGLGPAAAVSVAARLVSGVAVPPMPGTNAVQATVNSRTSVITSKSVLFILFSVSTKQKPLVYARGYEDYIKPNHPIFFSDGSALAYFKRSAE
jgi:hypothetical protein